MLAELSHADVAARLAAAPEERAAFLRAAAEEGHAEAQAVYGQMRLDAGNARAACAWFVAAARQGHPMALNMVGRCYDLGWGVAVDKVRAAECYAAAAARGLVEAMYNHATLLTLGEGVAEDRAAALALFERAAGLGYAKAANYVGSFAEDGWVRPRDLARAIRCYRTAAEGGDFRGAFNLARLLGEAGAVDEALTWIARAAAWGHQDFRSKMRRWLAASPIARFRGEETALC